VTNFAIRRSASPARPAAAKTSTPWFQHARQIRGRLARQRPTKQTQMLGDELARLAQALEAFVETQTEGPTARPSSPSLR